MSFYDKIIEVLDNLSKENERLKDINSHCCIKYGHIRKRMIELQKENKELKRELEELK